MLTIQLIIIFPIEILAISYWRNTEFYFVALSNKLKGVLLGLKFWIGFKQPKYYYLQNSLVRENKYLPKLRFIAIYWSFILVKGICKKMTTGTKQTCWRISLSCVSYIESYNYRGLQLTINQNASSVSNTITS